MRWSRRLSLLILIPLALPLSAASEAPRPSVQSLASLPQERDEAAKNNQDKTTPSPLARAAQASATTNPQKNNRPWIEKGALCILAGGLVWALGSKTVREQFDRASTLAPTAEATLSPTPTTTLPFRAEVQTVMNYSPVGRQLTDFVVAYGPASVGFVSPVPFLMHIQITNLQNIRSAITEYVVEIGLGDKGPWHSLSPISLTDCELYYLSNLKHPSPAVGGGLRLSEGSYVFRTPRDPSNLTTAIQLKPNRILEDELGRDIEPHNSIQGWAAFDRADGSVTVFEGQNIFYRITVNDSAGVFGSTILRMPLGSRKGERIADTMLGTLLQTGVVRDLHNRQLRPYTLK